MGDRVGWTGYSRWFLALVLAGREALHEEFGDDAPTMVAARRTTIAKTPWLEDIDIDVQPDGVSH